MVSNEYDIIHERGENVLLVEIRKTRLMFFLNVLDVGSEDPAVGGRGDQSLCMIFI